MEWRRNRQQHRPFYTARLGDLHGPFNRRLMAADHHLPATIIIRHLHHLAQIGLTFALQHGCLGAYLSRDHRLHTQQRRHSTLSRRHRRLHRRATQAQQLRGPRHTQRARRRQCAVLS